MLSLTPALTHLGVRQQQFTPCLLRPDCCRHVADLELEFQGFNISSASRAGQQENGTCPIWLVSAIVVDVGNVDFALV